MTRPILPVRDPPGLLELAWLLEDEPETHGPAEVAELCEGSLAALNPWSQDLAPGLERLLVDRDFRVARAEAFFARHAGHPWVAPLRDQRQLWVGLEGAELRPSDLDPVAWRQPIGYWVPSRGVWTISEVPGFVPNRLDPQPAWRQHIWGYAVPAQARIFELATAADWQALVRAYPRPVSSEPFLFPASDWWLPGPFYLPDFDAFVEDWDALRVSACGALRAANHVLEVLDGFTFMVFEERPEVTLWFRFLFGAPDDVATVPGETMRDVQPLRLMGERDTWSAQVEAARRDGWVPVEPDAYGPPYEHLRDDPRYVLMRRG